MKENTTGTTGKRIVVREGEIIKFESMSWEEDFDKQFVKDLGPEIEPIWLDPNGNVGPVKAFIQSLLDQQRKELLEMFREYKEKYPDADWNDAIGLLAGYQT